jgi:hypothetical protein
MEVVVRPSTGKLGGIAPAILGLAAFLVCTRSLADGARDPEIWAAQTYQKALDAPHVGRMLGGYLGRLLIVSSQANAAEKELEFLRKGRSEELLGASFLEVCDPESSALSLALNQRGPTSGGADIWPTLMSAARADVVLWIKLLDGKTVWSLMSMDDTGRPNIFETVPAPGEELARQSLATFVRETIGYDAIVLEQEGDLVLAKTPDLTARRDLSAVALDNSANVLKLTRASAHAGAWLKLQRGGKRYSIFRIVSSLRMEPLEFGSKLILER